MEILLLSLGVALILLGLATLFLPIVPGIVIIYAGILLVAWADKFAKIGAVMLIALAVLMLLGTVVDNVAGLFGARKGGASRWGIFGAGLGGLVGIAFGLPGVILGPAIGALGFEYLKNPDLKRAGKAGLGGLLGFFLAVLAKYVFGLTMVGLAALAYFF